MDPNDQSPDDPGPRTLTIQLNRDTLILLAAITFLAVAILLAVLFPPEQRQAATGPPAGTPTEAPTASGVARSTAIVVPPPATPTSAPATVVAAVPTAEAAYPEPVAPTAAPPASPTADALRPTAAPGTEGAPAGGLVDQPTAYPPPGGQAAPAVTPAPTSAGQAATVAPPTAQPTVAPPTAQPTAAPPTAQPTSPRAAAPPPVATSVTVEASSSDPPPTQAPPRPTAPPVDAISGTTYWTAARSPVVVGRDVQVLPGAALIIEPGVEVRLGPGVAIVVEGQLFALGQPGNPVKIVAADRARWEGIFGRPGSSIALDTTEISGGGAGGTLIAVERGSLSLRGSRVTDNGGHIRASDGSVILRDTEIAGNDMPYGAALEISYTAGGGVALTGNRIGGNRLAAGSPPVQITSQSPFDTVNLDIQRNLLVGQDGPDLTLVTNGPLQGAITCNALIGGANGLSVRGGLPQVPGLPLLTVRDNAIEKHTPPIIPIYLEFGIGRGATSEVALDMRGNWWESDTGPYEPDRHADGRGDAVGDMIAFDPWLTSRPECAPVQ